ncbi:unnamed protein product, partial [Heterosigma akashiwo]
DWKCRLKSKRCVETKKSGGRCNRYTVIGTDVCWQHLLYEHNLKIKKMRHGLGLFAWKKDTKEVLRQGRRRQVLFRKGEILMGYGGEERTEERMQFLYGDNAAPYALEESDDLTIDAACNRTVGALANHGNNKQANTRFTKTPPTRIKATKNIKEGDEIIINY